MQTETQVVGLELERVKDDVPTLFDMDGVFYSSIEKRPVEVISDRDMRIPLKLRPGGRSGSFDPAGGSLGRGSGPSFDKAVINTAAMIHRCEWEKKAEWATDDSRKAVLNSFRDLMATAMDEFRRNIDSWCMTAGDGVMATVTSVSTSGGKDTIVCTTDGFDVRLLRDDHTYSIYNSALTTRRAFTGVPANTPAGEAPIDLYDLENKTVRFSGTTGATTAGDKVVVNGLTATPPVWLLGVPYHHSNASSGQWLGLDRSTVPQIRASRVTASSSFQLPFARLALNKIGNRVGKDKIRKAVAWMHPCQKQAYEEVAQLVSIIQKQAKEEALNLYFGDGMQMAGCPVETSYSWDKTRIDFVVKDVWGRAENKPAGFYTNDGKKIFEIRGSDGGVAAAAVFYLIARFNLFVNNPALCVYISDLAVPTGY